MKLIQRGPGTIEALVEERLKLIAPKESDIPILEEVKKFIDDAVAEGREIFLFTDYDVDGITSTVIGAKLFWYAYPETKLTYRTPKRMSEGYGFNLKILDEVPEGALLITVDNGIVAFDAIKAAKAKGCKVVVIDHHLGAEDGRLPDADLVVDPNAIAGQAEFSEYCGCGLIYKLSQLYDLPKTIQKELRGIAALATVADCVPLLGENWLIAKDLDMALLNTGVSKLSDLFELPGGLSAGDAGFKICPALNAPGRLEDDGALTAVKALLEDSALAEKLVELNTKRKEMTESYFDEVVSEITESKLDSQKAISIISSAPEGLIGILAGRIAEKYMRPAFVFTKTETGHLKGSARTFGDNHLKKMLDTASDLLLKYGGHAAAAGLSLIPENFEMFSEKMAGIASSGEMSEVYYDIKMSPYNVKEQIIYNLNVLDEIMPFGEANPEPLFYIQNIRLFPRGSSTYRVMGAENQHIKLYGKDFDIVWFGGAKEYLAKPWEKINLVGKIGVNNFNGKSYYQVEAVYVEEAKPLSRGTKFQNMLNKRAEERYE